MTEPAKRDRAGWLSGVRAAFVYFSRIPVGMRPIEDGAWIWASAHLPLVGAVVGAASAGVLLLAQPLGSGVSASLALTTSVLLTGALHEDGLADSADALGGAHSGKRALEVMKDTHIGVFGAIALGLSLLVRFSVLSELNPSYAYACILLHALARLPPVWLLASLPRVSTSLPSSNSPQMGARRKHAWIATGWCVVTAAIGAATDLVPWPAAVALCTLVPPLALLAGRVCKKAVGGVTGDLLGATEQVGEILGWLTLLAALTALDGAP